MTAEPLPETNVDTPAGLPPGPSWRSEPEPEPLDLTAWLETAPNALQTEADESWGWSYKPTTALLSEPESPVLAWRRLVSEGPPGEGATRAERRAWTEARDAATTAAREAVQAAQSETAAYLANRETQRKVAALGAAGVLDGFGATPDQPSDRERLNGMRERTKARKSLTQQDESGRKPEFGVW